MAAVPVSPNQIEDAKRWRREYVELLDALIQPHAEIAARVAGWRAVREVLDYAGDIEVVELYTESRGSGA